MEKLKHIKLGVWLKFIIKKLNLDFEETFWLVVMLKYIIIIWSIAVHLDYEIQQMDAKTTFLNNYLNESIYMIQLEDFITKD